MVVGSGWGFRFEKYELVGYISRVSRAFSGAGLILDPVLDGSRLAVVMTHESDFVET